MIAQKTITMADAVKFSERMEGRGVFEYANGQIIPVHSMQPVEESLIAYVLSPEFDEKHITTLFPMPTKKHDNIVSNLHLELGNLAKQLGFKVYSQVTAVFIPLTESYREPDIVLVNKAEEKRNEMHQVLNPLLLIEVLSPSTQARDKSDKLEEYQSIERLEQYIIIWQDKMKAVVYTKIESNKWEQEILTNAQDSVYLKILNHHVSLASFYEDVNMDAE
jgi:Uma2 family endonuclease